MSMDGSIVFILGLIVLTVGAEMVVRGASRLAAMLGVKPLVIGLTVVAIGTSVPELAVGITASLQGSGSLVVGNIVGTNMVNILFILGLSALLQPLPLHLQVLKLDLPMMVIAAAMMAGLALDGALTPLDGSLLLGAAVLYTVGSSVSVSRLLWKRSLRTCAALTPRRSAALMTSRGDREKSRLD
jgi:cation:H+ antiporter